MIEAQELAAEPSAADRGTAVELREVSLRFRTPRGSIEALREVTLRVARGEIVAVVGPSGCGKSTLLELVCRLQVPDTGTLAGEPAVLMPQRDLLLPWLTALDNAATALRAQGVPRRAAREAASAWLQQLGLAEFAHAHPAELSGGMRQRISFVRSLLAGRPVLALDEPFAALDALTRAEMHGWLTSALQAEPRTVLLVTHDVEEAVVLADRVAVMSGRPGRIVAEIDVPLPRPRRRTDLALVERRARVLEALGVPG